MSATALYSLLGGGAGVTILLGVYDRFRNRRFDRRKQETTIHLDEAQVKDIEARAEQTSNTNLMAVGAFWQGQFNAILKQLEIEQDWHRRMIPRLREHRVWDRHVWDRLAQCDIDVGPPPSLDPDDTSSESDDSDDENPSETG